MDTNINASLPESGLEKHVEGFVPLAEFADDLGVSPSFLASRAKKAEFNVRTVRERSFLPKNIADEFYEVNGTMLSNGYISLQYAAEQFGPIYHNSKPEETINLMRVWIGKGLLKGFTFCNALMDYVKEDWLKQYAGETRYRVSEAIDALGISKKTFYRRIEYPEGHPLKILTKTLPSGEQYLAAEEIARQKGVLAQPAYSLEQFNQLSGLSLSHSEIRLAMQVNKQPLYWFKKDWQFYILQGSLIKFLTPLYEQRYPVKHFEGELDYRVNRSVLNSVNTPGETYDDPNVDRNADPDEENLSFYGASDIEEVVTHVKKGRIKEDAGTKKFRNLHYRALLREKIKEDLARMQGIKIKSDETE